MKTLKNPHHYLLIQLIGKGNEECMGADVLRKVMIVILNVSGFSGVPDTFYVVLNIFRLFPWALERSFWVEFCIGSNGMCRRTTLVGSEKTPTM